MRAFLNSWTSANSTACAEYFSFFSLAGQTTASTGTEPAARDVDDHGQVHLLLPRVLEDDLDAERPELPRRGDCRRSRPSWAWSTAWSYAILAGEDM